MSSLHQLLQCITAIQIIILTWVELRHKMIDISEMQLLCSTVWMGLYTSHQLWNSPMFVMCRQCTENQPRGWHKHTTSAFKNRIAHKKQKIKKINIFTSMSPFRTCCLLLLFYFSQLCSHYLQMFLDVVFLRCQLQDVSKTTSGSFHLSSTLTYQCHLFAPVVCSCCSILVTCALTIRFFFM